MTETLFCLLAVGLGIAGGFGLAVLWNVRVRPNPVIRHVRVPERTDLDLTSARWVEVQWDETARRVWINTERGLVGRIYGVGEFIYKPINQVGKQT
jgi:hypothetical protein